MGQNNSDLNSASSPTSASNTTSAPPARGGSVSGSSSSGGVGVRRAGSQHSHSHASRKKSVQDITPPKAAPFLVSQTSTPSTAVTTTTASPQRPSHFHHARARSTTSPVLLSHDLLPHSALATTTTLRLADKMGQSDSKPSSHAGSPSPSQHYHPPSQSSTLPVRSTPPPPKVDSPTPVLEKPAPATEIEKPTPPSPTSQPVDVPPPATHDGQTEKESEMPAGYSESPFSLAPANYIRPPRLPLPIEEEVHTPGSPILTPQDVESTTVLESVDVEGGAIPRKSSVLSNTTVGDDDDDVGDNEAFANDSQWGEVRVPTRLEWNGGGDKIFVTGTFCLWEKKVKLHRNKDRPGFSANVNLRPGTHHVKFLVDGEMKTSDELPTTVDWINILVNYIEVVAPLPAPSEDEKQPPAPAEPMPIPGAAITKGQATGTSEPAARPLDEPTETRAPETEADLPSTLQEPVPRKPSLTPAQVDTVPPPAQQQQPSKPKSTPAPPKHKIPRPKYTDQIPQFLIDLDNYHNPEDEKYQRAQRVATTLPQPPSLPMFLSKSILNGATPHKDDASVLLMPNHTVLNHLATSSIKNGVLATSGTTRYKRKFLTTIMYKPTSDDG